MRWPRARFVGLGLGLGLGCSAHRPPPPSNAADLGGWLSADASVGASTRQLPSAVPEPRLLARPVVIAPTLEAAARPRRVGRIDVDFQRAELSSAFRLLADAGHFNLIVQEGLTVQVSGTMRRVDPYDALVALAKANGVQVTYDREVVLVTKR